MYNISLYMYVCIYIYIYIYIYVPMRPSGTKHVGPPRQCTCNGVHVAATRGSSTLIDNLMVVITLYMCICVYIYIYIYV